VTRLRQEAASTVVALDAVIDEVLLRTLEPTMTALHRLFDAARPEAGLDGEPNGFDGLDRVGPPERLLPTEWLLAADEPDEFLRRYEHRELGYFRLDRVREQRSPSALVLLDTGPWQLGRPRIAQLACLVVLSRRAAAAGVELRWGTFHDPARFVVGEPDTLTRFLGARTFTVARDLPLDAFVDDCLVVSPHPGPPYPAQQLVLCDDGDVVRATLVDRRAGTSRQALLPMPEADDAVRVLRNPTGARTASTDRERSRVPISNLVFDEAGHKVLARVSANRIVLYPAPDSSADRGGRIRYVQTPGGRGVVAAAGRVRRSVLTVSVVEDGRIVVVDSFGGSVRAPVGHFPVENGTVPVPTIESPLGRIEWADGRIRVHLGDHVLTPTPKGYRLGPPDTILRWGSWGRDVTVEPKGDAWIVHHGTADWWHRGAPVVSPMLRWTGLGTRVEPFVIVFGGEGDELLTVGLGNVVDVLFRAGEPIVDAVVHPHKPLYAVRMLSGRVVVRTWDPDETVYEAVPT